MLLSLVGLGACGEYLDDMSVPVEISFDVVKYISEDKELLNDRDTFQQNVFEIGPRARLIMSLGDLKDKADNIRVDEKHRIWTQISLVRESDRAQALDSLEVCPITRSWMMLSNWNRAHPYGRSGKWASSGGDYAKSLCKKGLKDLNGDLAKMPSGKTNEIISPLDPTPQKIYFDVTEWFQNYVLGRSENFGLILISDKTFKIEGDQSPALSPRIQWVEFRNPWTLNR
jgi:hypothetical protein